MIIATARPAVRACRVRLCRTIATPATVPIVTRSSAIRLRISLRFQSLRLGILAMASAAWLQRLLFATPNGGMVTLYSMCFAEAIP
jgi:hypothetical protein